MQWRTSADKGEVRRVTFVCGDIPVLVNEVVDTVTALVNPDPVERVTVWASETPTADVWDIAGQYPLTPDAARLVIVREAQALKDWSPLGGWLAGARFQPGVHLLFVSDEADLPNVRGKPAAHIATLAGRKQAHLVRCTALKPEDAIGWVRRRARVDQDVAHHLLRRLAGDLGAAAQVCAKIALFDGQASRSTVDALCTEVSDEFVDELIAGRKRQALHALPATEPGAAIGLLVRRVDLLGALWRASRAGQSAREITGHPPFLVHRFLTHAKHYDPQRCVYARRVLAVIDDAHRNGARDGVMEALVTLW